MKHTSYWLIEQVRQQIDKRDWKKLPASFEQAQVKRLIKIATEHLRQLDSGGTVAQRIALNKAATFDDLLKILEAR